MSLCRLPVKSMLLRPIANLKDIKERMLEVFIVFVRKFSIKNCPKRTLFLAEKWSFFKKAISNTLSDLTYCSLQAAETDAIKYLNNALID